MKRVILVMAAASMLPLTGCAMQPGTVNSAGSVSTAIARATGVADSTYIAAYSVGAERVRSGALSRADFLTWEAVAYNAVLLIRSASTIADLTAAQAQLAQAVARLNP